ncbi:MAG: hypothetical protein KDA41_14250 [Planctomycetales bacterium]|nr:hypothetical protein [Planctomycetales bacterium]
MTPFHEHFIPIFLSGCFIAAIASLFAARQAGCALPGALLLVGVLTFWATLFFAADRGYRAWQSMPNPPGEAFSDASVVGALVAGWLPGGLFCLVVFGLVRGYQRLNRWANPEAYFDAQRNSSQRDACNPRQGPEAG